MKLFGLAAIIFAIAACLASVARTQNGQMPNLQIERILENGHRREKKVMVLENGTKLILLRHNRDMQGVYRYEDARFSFWLVAFRWNEQLEPIDTWTVLLGRGLARIPSPQREQVTQRDIELIKQNIETSLRAWPPAKQEAEVSIRRVVFDMALD